MQINNLILLFERDLDRLSKEIESYSDEKNLWLVSGNISNSAGNLTLHLIGNLFNFVAKEIGGFDYTRDRKFEFKGKNIPLKDLLNDLEKCKHQLIVSLEGLDSSLLDQDYPIEVLGTKTSYSYILIHLYGHLNYHLGQVNYHRRMLDK